MQIQAIDRTIQKPPLEASEKSRVGNWMSNLIYGAYHILKQTQAGDNTMYQPPLEDEDLQPPAPPKTLGCGCIDGSDIAHAMNIANMKVGVLWANRRSSARVFKCAMFLAIWVAVAIKKTYFALFYLLVYRRYVIFTRLNCRYAYEPIIEYDRTAGPWRYRL